jgi:hypothetical protein
MADDARSRIETGIGSLREERAGVREETAGPSGGSAASDARGPVPGEQLLEFLDRFRAGEALGEAGLGAWLAVCTTDYLRGGLRTIQMREGFHARLLEERLKELGGAPRYETPEAVESQYLKSVGSRQRSDREKLQDFVKLVGKDIDVALRPIHDIADRLDHDPETQSLLRTIAQDERSTLEFLERACQLLGVS